MSKPTYHRQSRTPSSEQYQLMAGEQRLGHLDLHFGNSEVFATLVLDAEMPDSEIEELIERIDEDLVLSSDVAREDFFVRVYIGREVTLFSDELLHDEFVANGHEESDA